MMGNVAVRSAHVGIQPFLVLDGLHAVFALGPLISVRNEFRVMDVHCPDRTADLTLAIPTAPIMTQYISCCQTPFVLTAGIFALANVRSQPFTLRAV